MVFLFRLSFALLVLSFFNPLRAETIQVALNASIQEAIDLSSNGDVLQLSNGTYEEDIDFNGKAISINGDSTILKGTGSGPVVTINSDEGRDSILAELTIRDGSADKGGGILIENTAPTIRACNIINNRADSSGSGIFISGSNSNSEFALVQNNLIARNRAVNRNLGDPHGIQILNSSPEIINNTIIQNDSNGIFIAGGSSSNPIVKNNILAFNGTSRRSQRRGRGICFVGGPPDESLIIRNNLFFRNVLGDFFLNGENLRRINRAENELNLDGFTENLRGNPRFRNRKSLDLRLRNGSRAIDAGDDGKDIGLTGGENPHPNFL